MGWWKVQGTEDIVGDDVFSILREATEAIADRYKSEFGRVPSRTEWQRLIQDSLEPSEDVEGRQMESLFAENCRPQSVAIVLEPATKGQ